MLTALKVVAVGSVFMVSSAVLKSPLLGALATAGFCYAYGKLAEDESPFD